MNGCQPRLIVNGDGMVTDMHCRKCGRAIEEVNGFWRHVRRCVRCGMKPAHQPMATCLDCYAEVRR